MAKEINYNAECRARILNGAKMIFDAVKTTYGAGGRNVVIARQGDFPHITKDGVTVAKSITVKDGFNEIGIKCLQLAASRTCESVGDGTTSSIILSYNFLKKTIEACDEEKFNPRYLKDGIDFAVQEVINYLKANKKEVKSKEDLKNIALISSNGSEEISDILAECFDKIGADGCLEIQNSPSYSTSLEFVEGISFQRSFVSPYFINDRTKNRVVMENALIFIYNEKLHAFAEIRFLMEKIIETYPGLPILLICKDYAPNTIADLVANHIRGNFQICAVQTPPLGDMTEEFLEDIAVMTGGTVISKAAGHVLKTSTKRSPVDLIGKADQVSVSSTHTTITKKGDNPALESRVEGLRHELEKTNDENTKKALQIRISQLTNGVALFKVGGATELEILEKKDRVEDAMFAVKAAMKSGIVSGGGTALACAADMINQKLAKGEIKGNQHFLKGVKIVAETLVEPIAQLIENSAIDIEKREFKQDDFWTGLNLITEEYGDLFKFGIIDPEAVIRESLVNSASIATTLMLCEAGIVEAKNIERDSAEAILRGMMQL